MTAPKPLGPQDLRWTLNPKDVAKALKLHRRQSIFNIQGFVGATMAFHADVIGVAMTIPQVTPSAVAEEA